MLNSTSTPEWFNCVFQWILTKEHKAPLKNGIRHTEFQKNPYTHFKHFQGLRHLTLCIKSIFFLSLCNCMLLGLNHSCCSFHSSSASLFPLKLKYIFFVSMTDSLFGPVNIEYTIKQRNEVISAFCDSWKYALHRQQNASWCSKGMSWKL